jgi:iron complex transport system substrate-binding protein
VFLPRVVYIIIFIFVLVFSGCADHDAEKKPGVSGTVVDDLGRTVHVPSPILRIVSLAPSITEMLVVAGGLPLLAGITTADDYPPEVLHLPSYSALPVNFEAILALQPDLILATSQVNNPGDAAVMDELGIPTFFLKTGTLDDVTRSIRVIGSLLGTELIADAAADSLEASLHSLKNRSHAVSRRPKVLVMISEKNLFSFGMGSYVNDMVWMAGGVSVTAEIDLEAPVLSDEFVLTHQPDVIIGTFPAEIGATEILSYHPEWNSIPAIANDSVFALTPELILRPGPRILEGTWQMLAILHPEETETGESILH